MSSDRPILHVVPAEPWGGIQALVPLVAREQVRHGRSVQLICLGPGARIRELAADYGLGEVSRSVSGPLAPLWLLGILLHARRAIIHSHCEPVWASAIIALVASGRWIEHAHTYPLASRSWKTRISHWLQRTFAAQHIAVSDSVGRALVASEIAHSTTLNVVHNGLSTGHMASFKEPADERHVVGFVGRVVKEKGIFDFVKLVALLADEPGFVFVVYGDGADLAAAQALATTCGIGDRITFHGYVEDIAAAWAKIHVGAILSHREPFGLVFLEAALSGTPSISYDTHSGGSEVAATLASAHRVARGDVAAVAEVVRSLAADPTASRAALDRDQITIAERFNITVMERGVAAVYDRLDGTAVGDTTIPEVSTT